jgi:hypothetical protein
MGWNWRWPRPSEKTTICHALKRGAPLRHGTTSLLRSFCSPFSNFLHFSSLDAMHGCFAFLSLLRLKRNFCSSPPCSLLGLHFQRVDLSPSPSLRAGFATAAVVTELRRNPITHSLHCPALSPIILQLPHINQGADRTLDMLPSRNGVGGCSNRRVDFSPQTMLTG